ncbi:MAG TPA: hypothetical protein DCW83_14305 [Saprospirales bacterium]|mgnify:FL=1|jgi:translation initiation factor RLI1|nr:hypothetical protein [Saprospiraceae bacterium]HAV29035.1 hypothetical protein [Saprospirales bacterium]HAW05855.1 hypothetical protein [Saprospirales bacterium]
MKFLFILLFAAFGLNASAQNADPKVTKIMQQELQMIQKDLRSQDKPQVLSANQTSQLKELLMVKSEKVNVVRASNQDKLTKSLNLDKIFEEFEPAILGVFNSDQKKAYKESARNKRRYTKKN